MRRREFMGGPWRYLAAIVGPFIVVIAYGFYQWSFDADSQLERAIDEFAPDYEDYYYGYNSDERDIVARMTVQEAVDLIMEDCRGCMVSASSSYGGVTITTGPKYEAIERIVVLPLNQGTRLSSEVLYDSMAGTVTIYRE